MRILSLGQPAKYGANSGSTDNTDAFQAFMNSNTKGTATMQMLTTFTHITDLDLSNYEVIILQALYTNPYDPNGLWTYSAADAVKYAQCVGYTPMTSYTVPQFWYNVFRWVAQTTCLTIVVPPTAGTIPQIVY